MVKISSSFQSLIDNQAFFQQKFQGRKVTPQLKYDRFLVLIFYFVTQPDSNFLTEYSNRPNCEIRLVGKGRRKKSAFEVLNICHQHRLASNRGPLSAK